MFIAVPLFYLLTSFDGTVSRRIQMRVSPAHDSSPRAFRSARWLSADASLDPQLAFPLMVKPSSEGTSIGITQASVVHGPAELRGRVEWILAECRQPALVEEFIGGTEYTIGIVGDCILPVLELDLTTIPGRPAVRDPDVKEIDTPFITPFIGTLRSTRIRTGTGRSL